MDSRDTTSQRRGTALIIGAGCTGLSIAQGLKKSGIPCIVFERDAALSTRRRDWNMGLHWAAPVLQSLIPAAQWERIQTVQVDPNEPTKALDALTFLNTSSGEQLGAAQIDYFYRLKRSALRSLLSEGLDVQYSKRLVDIVYAEDSRSVTAKFEDGTDATGRILIGADGPRSVTRQLAISNDGHLNRKIPISATWAQARFPREQAIHLRSFHPLYLGGIHPAGEFSFFGLQDGADASKPETWLFFFYISYNTSSEEQHAMSGWTEAQHFKFLKDLGAKYTDPWKSAIAWLPDDHPCWYSPIADWDPSVPEHAWDNKGGRVTIAGDAAHVMTYQRGQGLNHSLTDAGKLVTSIQSFWEDESRRQEAIDGYERELKERAGTEVRVGTANTQMLHDWERALQSPLFKTGLRKG